MTMKRHIGKITNTDQRCVVAFMQIPGREDHALVIPTDSLPPRFEQAVMDVVESPEGQAEETVAKVLGRRLMPDTGKTVLQTLHEHHMLMPVPVNNIVMMPRPSMTFPLVQILREMGATVPALSSTEEKFNPHTVNREAHTADQRLGIARNLIVEAELLEVDAKRKREQAYSYAPELVPTAIGGDTHTMTEEDSATSIKVVGRPRSKTKKQTA